ncbi:MAG: hypothetical protein R6W76_00045 [Caldilinea sp.]
MSEKITLKVLLSEAEQASAQQHEVFALLTLGILESMEHGLLSAADAVQTFFHAENCLFVRQQMRSRTADEIMSRGVQLPDLFDVLPPEAAPREFRRELSKMHALCLALLERELVAA